MGIIKAIASFKWGYLLIAILLCLAGLCVIFYPTESFTAVSYIIACGAIASGIVLLVKVLADRKRGFSFGFSIFFSCLVLVCGLVTVIIPEKIMELYPMFIGLLVIIDGSFKLQTVINAKRYKLKMWWFLLILACLTILGGFLTVRLRLDETELRLFSVILGSALFLCGIQNFFTLFFLDRIVRRAIDSATGGARVLGEDAVISEGRIADDRIEAVILPEVDDKKYEEFMETTETEFVKITESDFPSKDE